MNGNFEVDKSAYPYTAAHRGNKVVIRNTQTLEEVSTVNVGTQVGTAVALRLNSLYWSRKVDKLQDALDNIETVIRDTAKGLYNERIITGTLYQSIITGTAYQPKPIEVQADA